MDTYKSAEKLFNELNVLRTKHEEALKNVKKANKYVAEFPATFIESAKNLPHNLKPTLDNMKNSARSKLAEEFKAKKEMEQLLEEITLKLEIISNQVELLKYMPKDEEQKQEK